MRPCPAGFAGRICAGRHHLRSGHFLGSVTTSLGLFLAAGSLFAEIRVAGSDLLGPEIAQAIIQSAEREGETVSAVFQGSRDGLVRLQSGRADLALVAFAPDERPPGPPMVVVPWSYHEAVVVVPESNPLTQVSLDQLGGVFGAEGYASFTDWKDLGAEEKQFRRPLFAHALDGASGGLAIDVFLRTALRTPRLRSTVVRHSTLAELIDRLAAEEGGIAILPAFPEKSARVRALSVSRNPKDPAYSPTPENIHTGDYPLCWPVYLMYRESDVVRLRPLFRFLWSDDCARVLHRGGLVAAPANVRARFLENAREIPREAPKK